MIYRARYINSRLGHEYWRSLHAEDLREADFLARRMTRKGYRMMYLISE